MIDPADSPVTGSSGSSETRGSGRPEQPTASRIVFGALVLLVVLVAGILLWRLASAHTHRRPDLPLSDELAIGESAFARQAGLILDGAGAPANLFVRQVNGIEVHTLRQYLDALSGEPCADLTIERLESTGTTTSARVTWIEMQSLRRLRLSDDLRLDPNLDCFAAPPEERLRDFNGQAITSASQFEAALSQWRFARLALGLESPQGKRTVFVRVINWSSALAILLGGVLIAITGLAVFWLRPSGRSSWGLLVFTLVVGFFGCVRAVPHSYRHFTEQLVFLVLQCTLPAAAAVLLVTFGPLRNVVHRLGRVAAAGLLFGAGLLAADFLLAPDEASVGVLALPLFLIWASSLLVLLAVAGTADWLLRAFAVPLTTTDFLRSRLIRWAILIAFLPLTLYTLLLPSLLMKGPFGDFRPWVELSVAAFPILIGYAVVRHDALRLNDLVVEGVALTSLLGFLSISYAATIALALPRVQAAVPGGGRWLPPIAIGLAVLIAGPLHRVARSRLSRWLERDSERRLSVDIALGVEELQQLPADDRWREVASRLQMLTSSRAVAILAHVRGREWHLLAMAPERERSLDIDGCLPLLSQAANGRSLFLDDVLERPFVASRRLIVRAFQELQATAVLPLRSGSQVQGVVAIGARKDGGNYTTMQLRQLRALARQAARCFDDSFEETMASSRTPALGQRRLATYELERVIGSGATSVVYLGRHAGKAVAIKVPLPAIRADEALLDRFLRESRALSMLHHPHVLSIYEVGWAGDEPYVAMEYCADGTLRDILRARGRLSEVECLRVVAQVASGLDSGLQEGIIHRDVKPANVFVSDAKQFKVGDFGLARFIDETTVTGESSLLGTAAYIAPEVVRGERAAWLADQYSLGICLYEMLVGERPFAAQHPAQALAQHMYSPLPSIAERSPGIAAETVAILERMTAKSPDQRFQSWRDVVSAAGGID